MSLSLMAAVASNGIVGREGRLPWHLPPDLKRFKALTLGHPLIMGRKTFDGLPFPLERRTHVVLTRQGAWAPPADWQAKAAERGAAWARAASMEEALALAAAAPGGEEAFCIGGPQAWALALPRAERFYLTRLAQPFEGDARFPDWDEAQWARIGRAPGEHAGLRYEFLTLARAAN